VTSLVTGWRTVEERVREWDGGWAAAFTPAGRRADRSRRRMTERALRFLGLRELERGLAVRPDNLVGGIAAVRDQVAALGGDESVAVFGARDLDAARDARARKLWNAERLERGYRDLRERIARSAGRLERLAPERAMAESFLLGGRAIRAIVLDPLLPEPIAPAAERRKLVEAMRDYDRLGRRCWAAFMKEHGALPLDTPHDLRAIDASLPRAAAGGRR
jgi:phenylacetic acid degradation operon negative regulatory protein